MLKQPSLISSVLHLSLLFDCWTYDDNMGLKLKKPRPAVLTERSKALSQIQVERMPKVPGLNPAVIICKVDNHEY